MPRTDEQTDRSSVERAFFDAIREAHIVPGDPIDLEAFRAGARTLDLWADLARERAEKYRNRVDALEEAERRADAL